MEILYLFNVYGNRTKLTLFINEDRFDHSVNEIKSVGAAESGPGIPHGLLETLLPGPLDSLELSEENVGN